MREARRRQAEAERAKACAVQSTGRSTGPRKRAVACALEFDVCSEAFRERWGKRGLVLGVTRVGIHAGPASVGNFGGGLHFDYTAYGDTINTAARLETANKQLGTRICVSEGVVSRDPDFKGRPVGDPMLRGRAEPMRAYEPLSPGAYADPSIAAYLEAFRKPEAGDQSATPAFAALVGLRSDDQLAGFHLKRLLNGAVGIQFPAHTRGGFEKYGISVPNYPANQGLGIPYKIH